MTWTEEENELFCRKCAQEIPDDSRVCQYCGLEVVRPRNDYEIEKEGTDEPESTSDASISAADEYAGMDVGRDGGVNAGSNDHAESGESDGEQESASAPSIEPNQEDVERVPQPAIADATPKKKSRKMIISIVAVAVIALVVVVFLVVLPNLGLIPGKADPIVGSWDCKAISVDEDGYKKRSIDDAAVFKADGTVEMDFGREELALSGTWTVIPEEQWKGSRDSFIGTYSFRLSSGSDLTMSFIGAIFNREEDGTPTLMMICEDDEDFGFIFMQPSR